MPSDAKLGLVMGVAVVLVLAIVFFRKDIATATQGTDPAPVTGAPAAPPPSAEPPDTSPPANESAPAEPNVPGYGVPPVNTLRPGRTPVK